MINQHSFKIKRNSDFSSQFCSPLYESYCFSNIPGTIKQLLGLSGEEEKLPSDVHSSSEVPYDLVILLLLDGFGWRFLEKYKEDCFFLRRFIEKGTISKLTAQFPSTTAAHITCINTGLSVSQSGVFEWFYYEPALDRMIAPLLFSYAGDRQSETLKSTPIKPSQLYPTSTFYETLRRGGVTSYGIQHASIASSTYSKAMFSGAKMLTYTTLGEGLAHLSALAKEKSSVKRYAYLYFGDIDSIAHRQGLSSLAFEEGIGRCFNALEKWLSEQFHPVQKTALIVTADHGLIDVTPSTTFYLNEQLPEILPYLKKNRAQEPLVPAGSCRDFFLYVEEPHLEKAIALLKDKLKHVAVVVSTQELIDKGFFGSKKPSSAFLKRVGNAVILPFKGEGVWWYEKDRFQQHFYAAHGGLTPEEMEIPFLFTNF